MTRISAPTGTVARSPRRPRLILAVTALTALALAACGTEQTGAGGSRSRPADSIGAQPVAVPPSPDQQVAFMDMLNTVGQPCFPDAPSGEPIAPGEKPPTAPVEMLPIDKTPPASARPAPDAPATPKGAELDAAEKCEGHLHIERITRALSGLADPTPAQVRKVLNDLGYINERIHNLKQSGAATRFFLDLRSMGSSLCLDGSTTGSKIVIEAFGHPETGPFTPVERRR
ncbi:hypothetical protein [Streptomyces sp. NPDC048496]|uniref:hypothetical protein n=1 Tax=Streptomyces sp. NPDC048496 TaxID=3365558 RepID=UPI003719C9F0